MSGRLSGAAILAWLLAAAPVATAQPKLQYIAIISRHGVRSPTVKPEQLNRYSAQPWPSWDVAPGELTAHGRLLMRQFGAYDRAYLVETGLLAADGCGDASHIYIHADSGQRTLETGKALAEGILAGCKVQIHSVADGESDPIFDPLRFAIGKPDRNLAVASVLGRIGGHAEDLAQLYLPAIRELQQVLLGDGRAAASLWDEPVTVVPGKGDSLVEVTGTIRTGSTLAENLLLEFTDGRSGNGLGWGRLTLESLRRILNIHAVYADLARRTPYLARARGSNLLFHVLQSLEQAVSGQPVPGALGSPDNHVLILAGHDTNLSNLSGMMGIDWLLPGYPPDDTPPGGALVFELWRGAQGAMTIRTYYTAQSLEQMQGAVPLTLETAPLRGPVFVPGCSGSDAGYECGWAAFRRVADAAIDHRFVQP